ncbi:hypothetical protein D3C76_1172080 [compost metagenome]
MVVTPTPPVVATPSPDVVVYAEEVEATASGTKDTQLVFLLKDAGSCEAFDASHIILESADGTITENLSGLKPEVNCEVIVESGAGADAGQTTSGGAEDDESITETGIASGDDETANHEPTKVDEDSDIAMSESQTTTAGHNSETPSNDTDVTGEAEAGQDTGTNNGSEPGTGTESGTDTEDTSKSVGETVTEVQDPTPTIDIEEYKSSITVKLPAGISLETLNRSSIKVGTETFKLMEKPL